MENNFVLIRGDLNSKGKSRPNPCEQNAPKHFTDPSDAYSAGVKGSVSFFIFLIIGKITLKEPSHVHTPKIIVALSLEMKVYLSQVAYCIFIRLKGSRAWGQEVKCFIGNRISEQNGACHSEHLI